MSKQRTLIKNTAIIALGKLSTQFLTFLLLPLYTTYLTTSEFGAVDLIMTYVMLLAPLVTVSLEMAAFRFLIDARADEAEKRRVISGSLQLVGALTLAGIALSLVLHTYVTIPYYELVIGVIVAVILSNMFLQIARGLGNNLQFSIGSVVAGLTTIIANIVLIVQLGMGAQGMLLAILLGNVACAIYLFFTLRIYRYTTFDSDRQLMRKLLGYSAPLVPNGVSWWVINAADRTLVTLLLGVAANGIYAVAYRFPLIFTGLFSFFGMSWTESASLHINSPDRDKFFSQTMEMSMRLFGAFGLVMIAGVPLVFNVLVAENYREAYMYIPILIVGAFFNSIVGLYSAIYIAKKKTRAVMNTSIAAAVISVAVTAIGIPLLGLYAPALGMAIAYFAFAVFRHYDVKKYVSITYNGTMLAALALLYSGVIAIYYLNNPILNILNLILATAAAFALNKDIVTKSLTLIKSRLLGNRDHIRL